MSLPRTLAGPYHCLHCRPCASATSPTPKRASQRDLADGVSEPEARRRLRSGWHVQSPFRSPSHDANSSSIAHHLRKGLENKNTLGWQKPLWWYTSLPQVLAFRLHERASFILISLMVKVFLSTTPRLQRASLPQPRQFRSDRKMSQKSFLGGPS